MVTNVVRRLASVLFALLFGCAQAVIDPIWARGYRGFFLDTLDSYESVTQGAARRADFLPVDARPAAEQLTRWLELRP